jgi:tRNA N6-adenosine threonylcarbamoyltransferase
VRVLAIESSCDETAVALVDGKNEVASRIATQEIHARWGGVIPEIASRLHQKTLALMVKETMEDAGWNFHDLEGVAVTRGPGLVGALLVGLSYAKGLATALNIPLIGINHLEGHLWATEASGEELELPALALLVSGGHTELFRIEEFGKYTYLGGTLDDAAGEAFDKVGGLLGIPYPAGAELSKLALEGDPTKYKFALAKTPSNYDFSYSGLKSAVMRLVQRLETEENSKEWHKDIAASFQEAVVDQIINRVNYSLLNGEYKSLVVGGGVAANRSLRSELEKVTLKNKVTLAVPPFELCTDNAAMIAYVGQRMLNNAIYDPLSIKVDPNLTLVPEN